MELTDQIFSSALQDSALQDEVYCQILKQLTHNTKRSARDRMGPEGTRLHAQAPAVFTLASRGCPQCSAHGGCPACPGADSPSGKAGTLICPADLLGVVRAGRETDLPWSLPSPTLSPLCPGHAMGSLNLSAPLHKMGTMVSPPHFMRVKAF